MLTPCSIVLALDIPGETASKTRRFKMKAHQCAQVKMIRNFEKAWCWRVSINTHNREDYGYE